MVEELRQVASMCSSADVERQQAERGCGVWTATTIAAPQLPTSTSKFTRPSHTTPHTSLPAPAEVEDSGGNSSPDFLNSLLQQSYRVERPGTGEMRHGTEGWKCLETSFRVGYN